MPEDFSAYMDC